MGDDNSTTGSVQALWRYPIKSMMGEELAETNLTERGLTGDRAYAFVDKTTNRAAVVRTWASSLMSYRAEYLMEPNAEAPAGVRIRTPDGAWLTTLQPDIEARISAVVDRTLSLMTQAPDGLLVEFPAGTLAGKMAELTAAPAGGQAPAGTFFDVAPVHLIAASTISYLSGAFPRDAVDARRFRPNIVVAGIGEAFVENKWAGRMLAIGDEVVLQVSIPCPRCVNVTLPQDGLAREPGLLKAIAQGNMVELGDIGILPCAGVYAGVVKPGRIRRGDALRLLD
jgi:uncharacterized protein YcbX